MRTVTYDTRHSNYSGMTSDQIAEMHRDFYAYDVVRQVERWSIREFMRENAGVLKGRVLDYGAGTQPYRNLIACAEYVPWSPGQDPSIIQDRLYDGILCNQVAQYVTDPRVLMSDFWELLGSGGCLVMTFPTNWDEVEDNDLFRFTAKGMEYLLHRVGFKVVKMERRAEVAHGLFRFPLGYGCVAVKP